MTVLYTKKNGKIRVWQCFADGADVVTEYGELGGKQARKVYTAEAKNGGRSNATTPEQQAVSEVEAKIVYQLKHGYFHTIEEAENWVSPDPMKCQDMKDHAKKMTYPHYVSPKLDGLRMMIDSDGDALSKAGEVVDPPSHWRGYVALARATQGLDGEVYAGTNNLSLQKINSAFKKPNENTPKLKYFVYDLPIPELTFEEREFRLTNLKRYIAKEKIDWIEIVKHTIVHNEEEMIALHEKYLTEGYEGTVHRTPNGLYEFGKRSCDMQKKKPRFDAECVVLLVRQDKNKDGVLLCKAINGKQSGVEFECLMRKDADEKINYRKYENAVNLIGESITYEFESLSEDKVPLKPVAVAIREIDEHFKGE